MPYKKIVMEPCDDVYLYDGSLAGLFCCVYEGVYSKRTPIAIVPEHEAQPSFYTKKYIYTDNEKAVKVRNSVISKISPGALKLIEDVFLSCLKEKELAILRFLLTGYAEGPNTMTMIGHKDVSPLVKAQKHLMGESHLFLGFIRFSDCDGRLVSEIAPKNFVLPYIADHFVKRFPNEEFMIYDKTHKMALVCKKREKHFLSLDAAEFPEASETEERYRELWKRFYKIIAIEERFNPKCRMSHIPKRYWGNMTEMRDLLVSENRE